jgi:CRP-like cAMP-binding protein
LRIGGVGSISAATGWNDPVHPSTVKLESEDLEVVADLGRQIEDANPDDVEAIPTRPKQAAYAPAPPEPTDEEDEVPTGLMRAAELDHESGDTAINPSALAEAPMDDLLSGDRSTSESGTEDATMVVDFSTPDPDIPPASSDLQGESLARTIAAGLDQPSVVAGRQDSMAAIELRDSEFEVIDSETDSGEIIDTARLTEGWDRIAEGLAKESDDSLLKVSAGPSTPGPDRPVAREGEAGQRTPSGGLITGSSPASTGPDTNGPVPEIPLFSSLSRAAFVRLVERMGRRRLAPGEVLVAGGHGAEAIHVVARGGLKATRDGDDGRPVLLARLGPGEFVGEFTFLTGVPSPATLSAEVESEVLRISNAVMRSVVEAHPEVETVLWRFFVDRMTHSLLATSALFQGLTARRQVEIGRLFKPLEVRSGSTVIREGEPSAGLYLVVSGGVDVLVGKGEARRRVASLTSGEFFGLRTAASGTPPTSRVVTTEDSMLLVLPSSDFREILEQEPSVQIAVDTVSGMRRLLTNAMFQGHTSYSSDGLLKF